MGRPPSNGAPSFRFHPSEVAQMDAILQKHEGHVPPRDLLVALADRFSNSPERAGKIVVQMKQVWNWFQNRRYSLRAKLVKPPEKPNTSFVTHDEISPMRNIPFAQPMVVSSAPHAVRYASEASPMEFEARSARDGAWYDVQEFLSHRYLETGNPEVLVRFSGFGQNEDEWVNVRNHARQRSLPCEAAECIVVLPGDRVLCFQEGKEQALYFDAHVLDAQRRRHDVRGCRCRFLVRYDHDQSEEIVPLKKLCRRPETDYRLQQLQIANEAAAPSTAVSVERSIPVIDLTNTTSLSPTADVRPHVQPQAPTPSPLWSPTPSSASVLSPPAPAYASAPLTVSAQISVPITSVVTETPALAPEQKTVKDDTSVQIQVPMAELNKTEKGYSALVVPEPSMTETTSIPTESIAAKNDIPISVSESNQAESVNGRASDGEAGAQANFKNPIDSNKVVVDTKMTETSDVKTDVLTESSISQSELNCNPIVEADGQEKVESSSLLAPAVNVSTVAGNGESTG